jgi:transcriptional regulator with XRE-family HTH domain
MRASKMAKVITMPQTKPGEALRQIRKEKRLTLAEVSRRTGLPVPTLSKVENGKLSLSYDKVVRICQGLDIDIAMMFAPELTHHTSQTDSPGRRIITRAGEGREIQTDAYQHLYPAAELLRKRFNPVIVDLRARTLSEFGDLVQHEGEEFVLVLEGSVEFHTEHYAPALLEVGDSAYFDSGMGHAYLRASKGPAKILSVCSATEATIVSSMDRRDVPVTPAQSDAVAAQKVLA